jgi:hypothetical protein
MARKRRQVNDENEFYVVEIDDWEASYSFHINRDPKRLVNPGDYLEDSTITLIGKIIMPVLKDTSRAEILITESPELDDHWKDQERGNSGSSIGHIQILRDEDKTFNVMCSVPSRSFQNVAIAVAAGKIKLASIWGTKLKWKAGWVSGIRLATRREE